MSDDSKLASVTAAVAEYQSLRTESLQAITNRITVMNFSFGALTIVLAGALTGTLPRFTTAAICALFVPTAAKLSLLIWLGEYKRSQRAGRYLRLVEANLNLLCGSPKLLTWETHLSRTVKRDDIGSTNAHMTYPYFATAGFMLLLGYTGSILGMGFCFGALRNVHTATWLLWLLTIILASMLTTIEVAFLSFFMKEWPKAAVGEAKLDKDLKLRAQQVLRMVSIDDSGLQTVQNLIDDLTSRLGSIHSMTLKVVEKKAQMLWQRTLWPNAESEYANLHHAMILVYGDSHEETLRVSKDKEKVKLREVRSV